MNYKTVNILVIFYLIFILVVYATTNNQPFNFLYYNLFDGSINFISEAKIQKIEKYLHLLDINFLYFVPIFPLIIYSLFIIFNLNKIFFPKNNSIFFTGSDIEHLKKYNINYLIAASAGLGIYLELAIIRMHSSFFALFAFFKNFSLLSCLLGLGVGYLFGYKKIYSLKWIFPMICIQILLMFFIKNTPIALFIQNPVTEQAAMGQGFAQGLFQFFIIYSFIVLIFVFNAMAFVPLGHLVSNLMFLNKKLLSYSWNLIGSVSGIIVFSLMSLYWTGPSLWFLLGFIFLIFFQKKDFINIFFSSVSIFIILFVFSAPKEIDKKDIYSPYQIVSTKFQNGGVTEIKTSNLFFQTPYKTKNNTKDVEGYQSIYWQPFNVVNETPKKVLIVGSGTGNDTAAALWAGVESIDAVEIDPVIIELGKKYHPENPYQSKKVNVIQKDARNFIRHTNKKYDLIIYGLLDSHASLSANGGIRLDSYVYTVQAFEEAKNRLNKDGYISLSFHVQSKELGIKIFKMLKKAFNGQNPVVYRFGSSSQADVLFIEGEKYENNFIESAYTFLISNNPDKIFTSNNKQANVVRVNFFDDNETKIDLSTDNWPFFYMPVKVWPKSYLIIVVIIFICSFLFIKKTSSLERKNFSITCFFLGAGFMLIETKGITELALIYGSTWFVVSIVIGFILLMAYLANLLIIKNGRIKSSIIYFFIISSLLFGYYFTFIDFANFSSITLKVIVPAILTVPIFFSGLAFSKELSLEKSVGVALSSNILGAVFGGLLEYNSMYFGFKSLYLLGILMYFLGYVFSKESKIKLI